MSKLANLVCLVTGGSSGLGRATVENFVRNGSKVVICDLASSQGHSLAKELGEANCAFHPTDVTSEKDVTEAVELAKSKFGALNVLVTYEIKFTLSTSQNYVNEFTSLLKFYYYNER
jgi:3-hydroxyacyl-CoA dehydrogenase/3-hydroxy-2-methylbutyryl-CoA dehydrogenase